MSRLKSGAAAGAGMMTGGKMTGGTGVGVGSRLGTVVKECTDGASKRGVLTLTVIVPSSVPARVMKVDVFRLESSK